MPATIIASRKKATTYGRASKKTIVAMSESFANATQTSPWKLEHGALGLREHTRAVSTGTVDALKNYAGGKLLRKSLKAGTSGRLRQNKLNNVIDRDTSSASVASHTPEDAQLYELLSSEDDYQKISREGHAVHRKRRRFSSDPVEEDCAFVYDDSSLQEHIAGEIRRNLSQSSPFSGDAGLGNRSPSPVTPRRRNLSPCEEPHDPDKSRSPRKQKLSKCLTNAGKRTSDKLKPGSSLRDGLSKPRGSAQRKNQSVSGVDFEPPIPEERLPASSTKRAGEKIEDYEVLNGESCSLVTPPRSLKNTERSTTPRQKELWDKLLAEDPSNWGLGALDLPGLKLSDGEVGNAREGESQLSMVSDGIGAHTDKPRHRRIVDTLHSQDENFGHEDECMDDRPASDSTDDFSEAEETRTFRFDGANTDQTIPCPDSRNKSKPLDTRMTSKATRTGSTPIVAGSKVTYARQRSYLMNADLDLNAMLSGQDTTGSLNVNRPCYRAIGERIPKHQTKQTLQDQNWDSQSSSGGALRSIHELREAGGNIRLIAELEAKLEDIEGEENSSCTFRRMSLLDLVKKLQEPSNSRLFIEQGLESRLLALVGIDMDLITNSLHAVAILQIISCPSSNPVLPRLLDANIVDFLVDLLGLDKNLAAQAKKRDVNLPEYAQDEYGSMCYTVLNSTIWQGGSPPFLSCHVLALQCLAHIVRQTRESGSLSQVLSAYAIRRIVVTSIPSLSMLALPGTSITSVQLKLAVSILESCTVSNVADCQESLWEGETLDRIIGLLPLLYSCEEDECGTSRTLTLRLYVNLTNNNPGLCEKLSTPEVVEVMCAMITSYFEHLSSHAARLQPPTNLDNLILTLGALINLAESSDVVRHMVTKLHRGKRSYLAVLLELFRTKSQSAAEVSLSLA